jgi:FkbM family methyltransferase
MQKTFIENYFKKVLSSLDNDFQDNWDEFRFNGPESKQKIKKSGKDIFYSIIQKFNLTTDGEAKGRTLSRTKEIIKYVEYVFPHLDNLEWLFSKLEDEYSKKQLVELLAYRSMGHQKIKLSVNNSKRWENLRIAESLVIGDQEISTGFMHFKLREMDLNAIGYPIRFFFLPVGVVVDFIEQQYRCQTTDYAIECETGDHAIDAGGCWGDTALYFAYKAGPKGKVYSFEFLPDNLKIYNQNLDINPELKRRVDLIEKPIWSIAGEEIAIDANGPGSRLRPDETGPGKMKFRTESIDNLVETGRIEKVDFIKMDIEGAELAALKGAEKALRRFKPKLAITVYHSLKDFWDIPMYLDGLNLGYRFSLRHFTIHAEETVLYAKVI